MQEIINESSQIKRIDIERAKSRYCPLREGQLDLLQVPRHVLRDNKLALLIWCRPTTEDEGRQVEELADSQLPDVDYYVDSLRHAKQYPYGYYCLTFRSQTVGTISTSSKALDTFLNKLRGKSFEATMAKVIE